MLNCTYYLTFSDFDCQCPPFLKHFVCCLTFPYQALCNCVLHFQFQHQPHNWWTVNQRRAGQRGRVWVHACCDSHWQRRPTFVWSNKHQDHCGRCEWQHTSVHCRQVQREYPRRRVCRVNCCTGILSVLVIIFDYIFDTIIISAASIIIAILLFLMSTVLWLSPWSAATSF